MSKTTYTLGYTRRSRDPHLAPTPPKGPRQMVNALCGARIDLTERLWAGETTVCGRCQKVLEAPQTPVLPPAPLVAIEPSPGSVVMAEGRTGTAWQRYVSDGLWHSTTGRTRTWAQLIDAEIQFRRAGLYLLLDADQEIHRPQTP